MLRERGRPLPSSFWMAVVLLPLLAGATEAAHRGFLLAAPKRLLAGSTERICLTFLNVTGPAHVHLHVLHADSDERVTSVSHRVQAEEAPCVSLAVPSASPARARLLVQARFDDAYDYVVSAVRELRVQAHPTLVFVQTDRPAYRPGERVRVRVLALRHDFTPVDGAVAVAWLQTPAEVRVAQWNRPKSRLGLVEIEFQLAPEPPQGKWSVKVHLENEVGAEHSASFSVREYVLPRFSVSVAGPRYVLADAAHVSWLVCARYPHGAPVQGTLEARAEPKVPAWRSASAARAGVAVRVQLRRDGCAPLNATAARLGLRDWDASPASVRLSARVSEARVGAVEEAKVADASVEHQALALSFLPHSARHFKPGLPYVGRARALKPDGAPAAAEPLQVCLRTRRRLEWSRSLVQCRNLTTDADGFVRFTVPPQDKDVELLSLVATAVNYPTKYYSPGTRWRVLMDQPSAFFDVHMWYSPSRSYLEVSDGEKTEPRCGAPYKFIIHYTEQPTALRYLVTARGDIVQTGDIPIPGSDPEGDSGVDADADNAPLLGQGEIQTGGGRASFTLKVTARMSPQSALLLLYMRPDGEVVAASHALRPGRCFANPVRAAFASRNAAPGSSRMPTPGSEATLRVRAAPHSLCAVAAVDSATRALGTSTLLSEHAAFEALGPFHVKHFHPPRQADDVDYCARRAANITAALSTTTTTTTTTPVTTSGESTSLPDTEGAAADVPYWDLRRRKRSLQANTFDGAPASKLVDAIQAFDDAGILVLSDLVLETRPCHWPIGFHGDTNGLTFPSPMARHGGPGGYHLSMQRRHYWESAPGPLHPPAPAKHALDSEVRSHFPETWLWDLIHFGNESSMEVHRRLPDSVTLWEASVSCVSPSLGLGVSPPASITAFQPFFLDLVLPYSVKRGEVLQIRVALFNYLPHSLPVRIGLKDTAGLEVLSNGSDATGCVQAEDNMVQHFRVRATDVGLINVTVWAEVEPLLPEECGPEVVMARSDAVVKPLLVVPEGFAVQLSHSAFVCPSNYSGDYSVVWRLTLPMDVVEDSARAEVTMVGDLLGPTLQNLDHLVRLPMGCGEQNMILFVPNLYVIDYLNASGTLENKVLLEALKNLREGYQRQQNYRHDDGSFSAFGAVDEEGSLWLTSFVVRAFAQARRHIFVDEKDLSISIQWILRQQLENGCFPPLGQVFHKDIRGGLTDDTPSVALTAYVVISLFESGLPVSTTVAENAYFCLVGDRTPDVYALALKTYALLLLRDVVPSASQAADDALHRLLGLASRSDGLLWWENSGETNRALDVETTAYGILSLLYVGNSVHFLYALDGVRWIARNANAQGGFVSTQDTIVALDALSRYSSRVPQKHTALSLLVTSSSLQETFHIRHEDRLILQTVQLPELPTRVEVQSEGEGCAFIQCSLRYNKKTPSGSDAFELEVRTGPVASVDACAVQRVETCVQFKLPNQTSNMAVLEVNMVSGYIPDRPSLHQLAKSPGVGFKRWEEIEDRVNFYFEELSNKWNCVSFLIMQTAEVENPSFAVVTIYDYYQQELSLSQKYSTDAGCRNERLPDPQPSYGEEVLRDELSFSDTNSSSEHICEESTLNDTNVADDTSIPGHLNPDFVNVDHDLETPTGEEGPVPVYVLPQSDDAQASKEEMGRSKSCPHCSNFLPEDISEIYCNASTVYKLIVKKGHTRILLDLSPLSAPRGMRKSVVLLVDENCVCESLNPVSDIRYLILMDSSGTRRMIDEADDGTAQLVLDETISIFNVPQHHGLPEQIKQIRHICV